jgi:hypothetical protein
MSAKQRRTASVGLLGQSGSETVTWNPVEHLGARQTLAGLFRTGPRDRLLTCKAINHTAWVGRLTNVGTDPGLLRLSSARADKRNFAFRLSFCCGTWLHFYVNTLKGRL